MMVDPLDTALIRPQLARAGGLQVQGTEGRRHSSTLRALQNTSDKSLRLCHPQGENQ